MVGSARTCVLVLGSFVAGYMLATSINFLASDTDVALPCSGASPKSAFTSPPVSSPAVTGCSHPLTCEGACASTLKVILENRKATASNDQYDEIADFLRARGAKRVAEIGTAWGGLARRLLEKVPDLELHVVDPFLAGYDKKDAQSTIHEDIQRTFNLDAQGFSKVYAQAMSFDQGTTGVGCRYVLHHKFSVEAAPDFADGSFDGVFIDGLRTYEGVRDDIAAYKAKVKAGGVLLFNDYGVKPFPGVEQAVEELAASTPEGAAGITLIGQPSHCKVVVVVGSSQPASTFATGIEVPSMPSAFIGKALKCREAFRDHVPDPAIPKEILDSRQTQSYMINGRGATKEYSNVLHAVCCARPREVPPAWPSMTAVLHPPSTEPYNLRLSTTLPTYSQGGQDVVAWQMLSNVTDGFFIESGAAGGQEGSNTLFMELHGWSGILVDPDIRNFQQLQSIHRKAHLFHGAISSTNTAQQLQFDFSRMAGLGKMDASSHGSKSGLVAAEPVQALMKAVGRTTLDFWSLDVEGMELSVLKTVHFDELEIGVITIEINRYHAQVRDLLLSLGFKSVALLKDQSHGRLLDEVFANPCYFQRRGWEVPVQIP